MTVTKGTAASASLAQLLACPDAYPEQPTAVTIVETHISWVFLTDRFAYKVKKPVRFEFLDYSTLSLRKQACDDEIRLNRRLAPGVYLKVVPIVATRGGKVIVDGHGAPIEWAVKMRRLPADHTLDEKIRQGQLTASDRTKLANVLARFYTQAAPLTVKPADYRADIEQHILANLAELSRPVHRMPGHLVRRAHAAQLRFIRLLPNMLDGRVCDGRIVEGHGDLRPEHIYIERSPVIIDCIEFNSALRTLDVVDELSFLAMECDSLGAEAVGREIIDAYSDISGDRPPALLLDFYKCYRACVRAKVDALRSDQLISRQRAAMDRSVERYLDQAGHYAEILGPPLLIVVHGLMGTGKTTLAGALADSLGLDLLRTDVIRRELLSIDGQESRYDTGPYRAENREQVYAEMRARAQQLLSKGLSVVLDGSFLKSKWRAEAADAARRAGAICLAVRCHCPADVAKLRIADRIANGVGASQARPEMFERQQRDEQPNPPALEALDVETTTGMSAQVADVLKAIKPLVYRGW